MDFAKLIRGFALFAACSMLCGTLHAAAPFQVTPSALSFGELNLGDSKNAHLQGDKSSSDALTSDDKLKLKGKPIPENDIWIAAVALEHELTLVTRDSHFEEVEDLKLEVW